MRLREQALRFALPYEISETAPESALALEMLEQAIQTTARRLANATHISAMSLEGLIDALERYGTDRVIAGPWQV